MKKLNLTFCSFPDFSSNAKPLYEYMKKRYKDTMNLVWIVRTDEMYEKLKEKNIEVYKLGTAEYYKYVKKTDVFFTTHADITGEKTDKSLYVELWHGVGLKPIGFLANNTSDSDMAWYNDIKRKIDYFIVPSSFWKVIFSSLFKVEPNRILDIAYPKLDYFVKCDGKTNLNKILNIDVEQFKKIIYYMPTFKNGCGRKESKLNVSNIFNFENYDEKVLLNYLESKGYLLCIKHHPSEEATIKKIEHPNIKYLDDTLLLENQITINEILNAADLLITDYSSIGVEFTFLEKPVIYLGNQLETYRKNRGIIFDNFEFWTDDNISNNIEELIKNIDDCINSKIFNKKRNLWFGNLKDGGCKQLCEFLFDKNGQINKHVKYYKDPELELEKKLNQKNLELENKNRELELKNTELQKIVNSKGWKYLEKIRKIKNKIKEL